MRESGGGCGEGEGEASWNESTIITINKLSKKQTAE